MAVEWGDEKMGGTDSINIRVDCRLSLLGLQPLLKVGEMV